MQLNKLDQPWSIGSEDYNLLMQYILNSQSKVIVELGSGESSFQLARDLPKIVLISLEDNSKIATKNKIELGKIKPNDSSILLSRIRFQFLKGCVFYTYSFKTLNNFLAEKTIDCLIVDGPVESMYPLGREASLYYLFDLLSIGAIIGLDDYHRASAKSTVNNWLSVSGNSLKIEKETNSFIILKKTSENSSWNFSKKLKIRSSIISGRILMRSWVRSFMARN